jgi:hypothetical protein
MMQATDASSLRQAQDKLHKFSMKVKKLQEADSLLVKNERSGCA